MIFNVLLLHKHQVHIPERNQCLLGNLHLYSLKRNSDDEEHIWELHKHCCVLVGFNLLFKSRISLACVILMHDNFWFGIQKFNAKYNSHCYKKRIREKVRIYLGFLQGRRSREQYLFCLSIFQAHCRGTCKYSITIKLIALQLWLPAVSISISVPVLASKRGRSRFCRCLMKALW